MINHLKLRIIVFLFPWNNPFITGEGLGTPPPATQLELLRSGLRNGTRRSRDPNWSQSFSPLRAAVSPGNTLYLQEHK